jgi:DNA-directed RNA polymerase specialized sigma24 family protein
VTATRSSSDPRITDQDQFGKYRQHLPALTRYVAARLRGRDRDAVDDCVHDAFCDALADPSLIGTDALGSLLRLAARAVTRHDWSRRRYVRAAYNSSVMGALGLPGRIRAIVATLLACGPNSPPRRESRGRSR